MNKARIFVTSDTHFGHDREFLWGPRGFENHVDHDREVIRRWNEVVGKNEYVIEDIKSQIAAKEKEILTV